MSREQLDKALSEAGYTFGEVEEGSSVFYDDWPLIGPMLAEHIGRMETELAEVKRQHNDLIAALSDPANVHANMLRGIIAKPEFRAFLHLYGEVFNSLDAANIALIEQKQAHAETMIRLGEIGKEHDELKSRQAVDVLRAVMESTPIIHAQAGLAKGIGTKHPDGIAIRAAEAFLANADSAHAATAAVKESLTTGEQPVADGVDWKAKFNELDVLVNNPHTDEFLRSVQLEAAHQQLRWGSSHDAGKNDADWFWLIGYLAGKAIRPDQTSEKRLHHVITTAAACLNWHARLTGQHDGKASMRPGIGPEKQQAIDGLAAQQPVEAGQ